MGDRKRSSDVTKTEVTVERQTKGKMQNSIIINIIIIIDFVSKLVADLIKRQTCHDANIKGII